MALHLLNAQTGTKALCPCFYATGLRRNISYSWLMSGSVLLEVVQRTFEVDRDLVAKDRHGNWLTGDFSNHLLQNPLQLLGHNIGGLHPSPLL